MNIKNLLSKTAKPALYEAGTAFMWTNAHISQQLLEVHLNPDVDLASRKRTSIEATASWIQDTVQDKGQLSILDLGCGPGLYCELFAEQGHRVTGVDISHNSIEYAKRSANEKELDIAYLNSNYIELELEPEQFDLIVMIFTDLGVLVPNARAKLLQSVYTALKPGGAFIFDVLKDNDLEAKTSPKTWQLQDHGFWKPSPYLVLSESFLYHPEKVILYQHTVVDAEDQVETYRFWTHFLSQEDVSQMLVPLGFRELTFREDILPEGGLWSGDNVLFTVAWK